MDYKPGDQAWSDNYKMPVTLVMQAEGDTVGLYEGEGGVQFWTDSSLLSPLDF